MVLDGSGWLLVSLEWLRVAQGSYQVATKWLWVATKWLRVALGGSLVVVPGGSGWLRVALEPPGGSRSLRVELGGSGWLLVAPGGYQVAPGGSG